MPITTKKAFRVQKTNWKFRCKTEESLLTDHFIKWSSASMNCSSYSQKSGTSLFLCLIFQEGFVAIEEKATALSGMKSAHGISYL